MTSSTPDKLVRMANQMADFFQSYPHQDAIQGIADHIAAFWTNGMREGLKDRIAQSADGVHALVTEAGHLPSAADPKAAPVGESPIIKEVSGPNSLGQMASDAG